MMEKFILHIQYECNQAGIHIPWDKVVHRLHPGSSGPAAQQFLNKLRDILVVEGHMVPPMLGKGQQYKDDSIRGYIRDMDDPNPTTVKIVRWNEVCEDRKESLVVPGITRGSGRYPRAGEAEVLMVPKTENKSNRRRRLPPSLQQELEEKMLSGEGSKSKRAPREPKSSRADKVGEEVDPAELDADDDYDPLAKKTKNTAAPKEQFKVFKSFRIERYFADTSRGLPTVLWLQL